MFLTGNQLIDYDLTLLLMMMIIKIGLGETNIGSIIGCDYDNFKCCPFDNYEKIPELAN
jgi:hypothetical protein